VPLLHAESYIETPEPSFDDWNGSVLANLGRATALSKEELVVEQTAVSSASSSSKARPQLDRSTTMEWQPNVDAAEFIPMSIPGVNGNSTTREQDVEGTPSASPSRRTRQKRRVAASERSAPFGNKRTRTDEELPSSSSTRPSVSEPVTGGDTPMGDAGNTEEDWQRRQEKRTNVVQSIKTTTEYEVMARLRAEGKLGQSAPRTPDGTDRNISKRKWEQEVMYWRNTLRGFTRAQTPSPDSRVILPIVESSRR
jgi:hypothetical protein